MMQGSPEIVSVKGRSIDPVRLAVANEIPPEPRRGSPGPIRRELREEQCLLLVPPQLEQVDKAKVLQPPSDRDLPAGRWCLPVTISADDRHAVTILQIPDREVDGFVEPQAPEAHQERDPEQRIPGHPSCLP